jgi:hypothetical protein
MIVSLHDDQHVARRLFPGDVPGRFAGAGNASDTETLALSERVVHQPMVTPDDLARGRLDIAGQRRNISRQKFPEGALADEADAGTVLLVEYRQHRLPSNSAHS